MFRGQVHIGYLAAIVAASNAGGAGSVIGDTTTTMMWLAGVSPLEVLQGLHRGGRGIPRVRDPGCAPAAGFSPIVNDPDARVRLDVSRMIIVALVLVGAIGANVYANSLPEDAPACFRTSARR